MKEANSPVCLCSVCLTGFGLTSTRSCEVWEHSEIIRFSLHISSRTSELCLCVREEEGGEDIWAFLKHFLWSFLPRVFNNATQFKSNSVLKESKKAAYAWYWPRSVEGLGGNTNTNTGVNIPYTQRGHIDFDSTI